MDKTKCDYSLGTIGNFLKNSEFKTDFAPLEKQAVKTPCIKCGKLTYSRFHYCMEHSLYIRRRLRQLRKQNRPPDKLLFKYIYSKLYKANI